MAKKRAKKASLAPAGSTASTGRPGDGQTTDNRSTGWKVPLLFCAGLAIICAAVWCYRNVYAPDKVVIPADLEEAAKSYAIDLESDEWGAKFKNDASTTASGFDSANVKDAKLRAMGEEAIAEHRLDAACATIMFMHRTEDKEALLRSIHKSAITDCATLPWSVFALRNMTPDKATTRPLVRELTDKWHACGRKLPPRPAPEAKRAAPQTPASQADPAPAK